MIENTTTPELTIALPAYEEADNLAILIPQIRKSIDDLDIPYEILVVDTETPRDDTPGVCARTHAKYVARQGGTLYSHAIRTALRHAQGRWVVFMDADGSHSPAFITKLWAERNNADIIIASRYIRGGSTDNPRILIFMSRMLNVIFRIALGINCKDVSNSFRLYNGDDLRQLQLECDNFDIVEEILVKLCAANNDYKIKEIPFRFEKRNKGKTKRNLIKFILSYIKTLRKLMRLKKQSAQHAKKI